MAAAGRVGQVPFVLWRDADAQGLLAPGVLAGLKKEEDQEQKQQHMEEQQQQEGGQGLDVQQGGGGKKHKPACVGNR